MKPILLLAFLLSAALAEYKSYDGYTVYQVTPLTNKQSHVLQQLYETNKFDFWSQSRAINHAVSVMVSPDLKDTFISVLKEHNLSYKVQIENVETTIKAERAREAKAPKVPKGRISFDAFYSYDDISEYIITLAEENPDIVRVEEYGVSSEGRPLRLVRVGSGAPEGKPTVFIEGAIHGRQWIAPPVVLYAIEQLIDPENVEIIENANWILVPVTNPDGYEYTRTYDRMWTKTRSIGEVCDGVDANRNFDFQWGGPGSTDDECELTFRGPSPQSEPEVASLVNVALAEERIDLYIAAHSYGNYILYPWAYTTEPAEGAEQLLEAGLLAADAIEAVAGTRYEVGNTVDLLYYASGVSDDWFHAEAGAPLSYTLMLTGGGDEGFDIPADQIQPVVAETWPGIVALYDYVLGNIRK